MRTIPITVNDEYIRGTGAVVGAAGSHSDVILDMIFGDAWEGLAKTIVWRDARHENPVLTVLSGNYLKPGEQNEYLVPIPAEPKAYAGKMTMTVKGAAISGSTETAATLTAYAEFIVMESLWSDEAETTNPVTASRAEQLQQSIDTVAGRVSGMEAEVQAIYGMQAEAETLPAGSEATVTQTLVNDRLNLTFGIPRGQDGRHGEKGDTGRAGEPGAPGIQGPQGLPGRDGNNGINGVVVETQGFYGFDVHNDGHLYLTYTGETQPDITLDQTNGHLYLVI